MNTNRETDVKRAGIGLVAAVLLIACGSAVALDVNTYKDLYTKADYAGLDALCVSTEAEIDRDEMADRILYYCGQAKANLFEKGGTVTDLTAAIEILERSAALFYLPGTGFALGKARLAAVDKVTDYEQKRATEWRALNEMWEAIIKRHAEEGYATEVVSDSILAWGVAYHEALVDRTVKDQDDPAAVRWLAARARMLSDRFAKIDATKGENETRVDNLKTIAGWMRDLYEATFFDRNPAVGAYKYLGDRREGEYDQTVATDEKFVKALYYYKEGLARAKTLKAKAAFDERIGYLCSLYQSDDKSKKVEYYKSGFHHAADGLKLMERVALIKPENEQMTYRYEPENAALVADLQKHFGRNLSGLVYFLWERGDYKDVVALRTRSFDTGFDWKTKADDLLRIADAGFKLARANVRDRMLYEKYREMSLTSASRAFKFALKKYGGARPTAYDDAFCGSLTAYRDFLSGFGETVEATNLDRNYGPACEGGPPPTPPAAPAATAKEGQR
jgi:hypothetical protein